jgi:hypothetical protein
MLDGMHFSDEFFETIKVMSVELKLIDNVTMSSRCCMDVSTVVSSLRESCRVYWSLSVVSLCPLPVHQKYTLEHFVKGIY